MQVFHFCCSAAGAPHCCVHQGGFNCSTIKAQQQFMGSLACLGFLRKKSLSWAPSWEVLGGVDRSSCSEMVTQGSSYTLTISTASPWMWSRRVIVLAPLSHMVHFQPVGSFILTGNQANHCGVVCELNDGVWSADGGTIRSKQCVDHRAQYKALQGPCVQDVCGGGVPANSDVLRSSCQKVRFKV